ncbi:hypothetical protein [Brucella microti]|uniref:Phage-related tail transmembrane protein n=1 Tax=Brucella microti (strain BCCN 7-01 / CAPM 6434 / CCM 4915) TaxID=568815 RepID=C7LJH2_BRUMC|nr:hypothetical protein [Brucella microti]ACU50160.1 phage-related tail transmembrane protein [Brucella microti CCM 4915]
MARTLIGELLLKVRADTKEAKSVNEALAQIERKARAVGNAGWGANFQRSMDRLKLAPREMDAVRQSWDNLIKDIDRKSLGAAMARSLKSNWKSGVTSHFAAVRAEVDKHERHVSAAMKRIRNGVQFGITAGIGYNAAAGAGMAAREAIAAASKERAVKAEAKFAGLSGADRTKINKRAEALAVQKGLSVANVTEVLKDSALNFPSTDAALAMSDAMTSGFLAWQNLFGKEGALTGIRAFNKAMDSLNIQDPAEYNRLLDQFMRVQQIVGRDVDPEQFALIVKYSRGPGKLVGHDYITQWLPFLAAETNGSDAGRVTRALFDQFFGGKASKAAIEEQERLGLRTGVSYAQTKKGKRGKMIDAGMIVDPEGFRENMFTWTYENLTRVINEQGLSLDNEDDKVAIAKLLNDVTSNSIADDALVRFLYSFEQVQRGVNRSKDAYGLRAAEEMRFENPFAAWGSFKDAMSNLSAATLPMETISAGLNKMTDAINAFQQKVRDGDIGSTGLLALGGIGAVGIGGGLIKAGYDLITAGSALKGAAVSLEAAAGSIGNGGKAPGNQNQPADKKSPFSLILAAYMAYTTAKAMHEGADAATSYAIEAAGGKPAKLPSAWDNIKFLADAVVEAVKNREPGMWDGLTDGGREQSLDGFISGPIVYPEVDHSDAVAEAQKAGQEIQSALEVKATPIVDAGPIMMALKLARELKAVLSDLGGTISQKGADLNAEINRAFADHQISP